MSPKQQFQASKISKGFISVIESVQMQAAFDAAMLEYQSKFSMPPDMATAAANEWRRQGAVQYLRELQDLMTKNKNEPAPQSGALYKPKS